MFIKASVKEMSYHIEVNSARTHTHTHKVNSMHTHTHTHPHTHTYAHTHTRTHIHTHTHRTCTQANASHVHHKQYHKIDHKSVHISKRFNHAPLKRHSKMT